MIDGLNAWPIVAYRELDYLALILSHDVHRALAWAMMLERIGDQLAGDRQNPPAPHNSRPDSYCNNTV